MLNLMIEKLVERKRKEADAISGKKSPTTSVEALSAQSRGLIKVVKKHGD